jgi:hypothetical protein
VGSRKDPVVVVFRANCSSDGYLLNHHEDDLGNDRRYCEMS